jgi:hypothetical protein
MSVPFPVLVLYAVLAMGLAIFLAWVIYQTLPEKVILRDGRIMRKYRGTVEEISTSEISEIKYHYHAVVGFVAVWEFVGKNEKRLLVDDQAKGINALLSSLEGVLPAFSLVEFKRRFDEGELVDVINVWKAA